MFLRGHMQNAYVTHDLDRAMEMIADRFKVERFDRFNPEMVVNTLAGEQPMCSRVASFWAGGLNIELIEPVSGYVDHYVSMLPPDRTDAVPRFPTALGASSPDTITLLGQDLATGLMGKVGFGELVAEEEREVGVGAGTVSFAGARNNF